jgi:chemotaxis protein MotA
LSTPAVALAQVPKTEETPAPQRVIDFYMMAGIVIALASVVAGIALTGVHASYFLQPTGMMIVLGGTLGVSIVTTPGRALKNSARALLNLFSRAQADRAVLIEQIMSFARPVRTRGLLAIEASIPRIENAFLRESLALAVDVADRGQLKAALESKLHLRERNGETDAKTLEVAGGFAPTIGVLGTVVGLIDVLRQFSNIAGVASGVGTAFVSTIYGLGLANLVLLPAANRIRANVAEAFETDEMIIEGVMALVDGQHPSLIRERLTAFVERGR